MSYELLLLYRYELRAVVALSYIFAAFMHSQADIEKAKRLLAYEPGHSVSDGMMETVKWFFNAHRS